MKNTKDRQDTKSRNDKNTQQKSGGNQKFSPKDLKINIQSNNRKLVKATGTGLQLAQSPFLTMLLAVRQWRLGAEGTRSLVGYHLKYVPLRDFTKPEPLGAYTVTCPYTILRDAKTKEKESRGLYDVVVIGLFKTNIGSEGNPPRIRMQVARVATGNQRPWVSPVMDWDDTCFLSGHAKAWESLSVFMGREFSYNSQKLQEMYSMQSLREFHEMTAADNERARAAYLVWAQTHDVMQDTPLQASPVPTTQLPETVDERLQTKTVRSQLETFTWEEATTQLQDRHDTTPEQLKTHGFDFAAQFADSNAIRLSELVQALQRAGTTLKEAAPSAAAVTSE